MDGSFREGVESKIKYRNLMYSIDIQSPEFMKYLERGEREAFQQLFETYHKALCFFAARIVRDHSEAEDIVQDVFLSFWKMDRGGFPNVKTIKTFLYNSVQHRCLNYLRDLEIRDRNYKNLNKEELDEDYFLCQQIRADVVAELFDAIDELPDRCKEIFKRSYVDGQEERKIAEELNISLNTIKTQKQRAKSYLWGRLGDLFVYAGMFFPGL